MKKLSIILLLLLFCGTGVLADESKQEVDNNQTYFTANVQTQPKEEKQQKITNHFTFFTINIQVHRVLKDTTDTNVR